MSPEIVRWIKIVVLRTLKEKNLTKLDINTLISAGMLGYVQCLKRFDPNRGVKFKTYAEYRIKGAVLDEVRKMIGDERCKNKRPRRVDEYDYTLISDEGREVVYSESSLDLETFFDNVPLTERELDILKCRFVGMNLREISERFGFSESRASQLLAKIKTVVYAWYKDHLGVSFKLITVCCPACHKDVVIAESADKFRCDICDASLKMENGNPIVASEEEPEEHSEENSDVLGEVSLENMG